MSEKWQDHVANSFVVAGKLGMEVVLGTGPVWAGSGGSWVGIEDSMQHLVGSCVKVSGQHDNKRAREVCASIAASEIVVFDKAYVDFDHLFDLGQRGEVAGLHGIAGLCAGIPQTGMAVGKALANFENDGVAVTCIAAGKVKSRRTANSELTFDLRL